MKPGFPRPAHGIVPRRAPPTMACRRMATGAAWAKSSEIMPLYEYELCDGDCAACGGRFTLRRPVTAPPLSACPACRRPIRKVISAFNTPSITKPVSITDAKKAGFTVLKRTSKGEYERQ